MGREMFSSQQEEVWGGTAWGLPMVSCAQITGTLGQSPPLRPPQITYGHFSLLIGLCHRRPVDRHSSESPWGLNKSLTEPRSAVGAHGPSVSPECDPK